MCLDCWDNEGRPFKVTPAVERWAPKFAEANPFGPLHAVVDDWNLGDGNIQYCRAAASPAEVELIDALHAMTWEERWATAILGDYPDFDPLNPF
jgi:hypothetical protein